MHKLVVTAHEAIRVALKNEELHSPQSRFVHRLHCLLLVGTGRSCDEVAELFGDDPRSIQRWVRRFQQHGVEGLRDKPHPGRRARLADTELQELELALANCPRDLGYAADAWNPKLLRAEMVRRFGVTLSPRHCQRLFTLLRRSALPESTPRLQNG